MAVPAALLWAVLGALGGLGMGRLSLRLESGIGDLEPGERSGQTWIERWLLPGLGFIGFYTFGMRQGMGPGLWVHSLWILVLIQILGFDLKHRLILDVVTVPAMVAAVALASFSPDLSLRSALFGILVGGGALLPLAVVSSIFHGGRGFGWGDVKLGMVIGGITGMSLNYGSLYTLWALIAGTLVGGVITVGLLLTRRISLHDAVPYGPFLIMGCGLILFFM
ncbi:MAG TPA: A24 family peptidase [Candidatus Nanopelagicaceae bacterium]|nr:A24 family peptidase [Candidatus Nanopelagicaceae bacterium]